MMLRGSWGHRGPSRKWALFSFFSFVLCKKTNPAGQPSANRSAQPDNRPMASLPRANCLRPGRPFPPSLSLGRQQAGPASSSSSRKATGVLLLYAIIGDAVLASDSPYPSPKHPAAPPLIYTGDPGPFSSSGRAADHAAAATPSPELPPPPSFVADAPPLPTDAAPPSSPSRRAEPPDSLAAAGDPP